MTPDDIADHFAAFGPVTVRRMFSGYGISAHGVVFAMALRSGMILRVDAETVHRYDAEGAPPFQYQTRAKTVVVQAFRVMPERLYDDPDELAIWAREAVGAAQRAKQKKQRKPKQQRKPAARKPKVATKAKAKTNVKTKAASSRRRPRR